MSRGQPFRIWSKQDHLSGNPRPRGTPQLLASPEGGVQFPSGLLRLTSHHRARRSRARLWCKLPQARCFRCEVTVLACARQLVLMGGQQRAASMRADQALSDEGISFMSSIFQTFSTEVIHIVIHRL